MGRFSMVADMLGLAFIFLNIQIVQVNYPNLLRMITLPALGIFIIVKFRISLDYIGSSLLLGNPISSIFLENQVPLIDFIKGLI